MDIEIIPSDKYFKSMSQAIIAADDVIQKNPALIKKLVSATLHGMNDIMADPDAAAVDYVKDVPEHAGKEAAMAAGFKQYNQYVYPGPKVVGAVDEPRLYALSDFYLKEGVISNTTPAKELNTNNTK